MSDLVIVGLLILILGSIILFFYFLRILFAVIIAKRQGLNLSMKQARFLWKHLCLRKDFLIGVREIWSLYPMPLEKLTMHYLAGGNLKNIKIGLYEFSIRNKKPDIWFLTTFDLAKRNLVEEIEKAEKNDWKFEL